MSIEEIIKQTIAEELQNALTDIQQRQKNSEELLEILARLLIVPQHTACDLAEVTPNTARAKVKAGKLQPLATETSRRNYFTLKDVQGLKRMRRGAK